MTGHNNSFTGTTEALHYLGAIKVRLELLYEHSTQDSRLLEQLSDEVDWIDAEIERLRSVDAAQAAAEPARADEDQVKALILKHCTVNEQKVLLRTVWKDGIDIDRPRTCIMNIADDLLASPVPSTERMACTFPNCDCASKSPGVCSVTSTTRGTET